MGKVDCEECAGELFKSLFGEHSGSLSLFTDNPYQRKKNEGNYSAFEKPAVKNDDDSERKSKKRTVNKDVDIAAGERPENGFIAHPKKEKNKEAKMKISRAELQGGFVPVSKIESNGSDDVVLQESVESKGEKRRKKETSGAQNVADETGHVENGSSTKEKKNHMIGEAKEKSNHGEKVDYRDVGKETHAQDPEKEREGIRKQNPNGRDIKKRLLGEKRKLPVSEDDLEEKFEKRLRGLDATAKENSKSLKGREAHDTKQTRELLQGDIKQKDRRKFMKDEEEDRPLKKKRKTREEWEESERKLLRTIFVGNLPITLKPKLLVREFTKYGRVENARLRSVPLVDTKLPRKAAVITKQLSTSHTSLNAYIVFEEASSAKAALAHNMSEFQGRHIRVDMATAPRKDGNLASNNSAEYDSSRSIFVGNIPFDVEDEDLYALFGTNLDPEMGVEAIRVPRDPQTSIGKGFGFVLFKSKAGASAALAKKGWNLKERKLRVVRMGTQQRRQQHSRLDAGGCIDNKTASRLRIAQKGSSPHARGPLPWEGTRASKSDGKPGKRTLTQPEARRSGPGMGPRASNTYSSGLAPRTRLMKRPAVLARKQAALLVKSGGSPTSKQKNSNNAEGKKKRDTAGNRGSPKEKKWKKPK